MSGQIRKFRVLVSAVAVLVFEIQLLGKPISETVDQIMAHESARAQLAHGPKVKEEKLGAYRATLPQNPDAPAVTQFANGDTNGFSGGVNAAPQTVGTSFLAIQLSEAPFIPPDTQMAVGPTQIIAIANGRIKVFDRHGVLGPLNADTDVFFSSVTANSTTRSEEHTSELQSRFGISYAV